MAKCIIKGNDPVFSDKYPKGYYWRAPEQGLTAKRAEAHVFSSMAAATAWKCAAGGNKYDVVVKI